MRLTRPPWWSAPSASPSRTSSARSSRRPRAPHAPAEHRQGLGNTAIVLEALTGRRDRRLPRVHRHHRRRDPQERQADRPGRRCARALAPLGPRRRRCRSASTTAMRWRCARREADAAAASRRISDLARQPELALAAVARVPRPRRRLARAGGSATACRRQPAGLDHGIAYEALAGGRIDVIDIYSTDAKIAELEARACSTTTGATSRATTRCCCTGSICRSACRRPGPRSQKLEGRIDDARMIAMNGDAELRGRAFADIARDFLQPAAGRRRRGARRLVASACSPTTSAG